MIPDSICEEGASLLSQNDFHIIESPVIYPVEPTSLRLIACRITISKENDSITYSFSLTLNNTEQEQEQSIAFYTDKLREGTKITLNNTTIPSDSYENEVMELTLKNSSNFINIEYTEEYDPDQKYMIAYIPELSFLKHYFTSSDTTIYVECKTDVLPYVKDFTATANIRIQIT